jgi:hypothetical protein
MGSGALKGPSSSAARRSMAASRDMAESQNQASPSAEARHSMIARMAVPARSSPNAAKVRSVRVGAPPISAVVASRPTMGIAFSVRRPDSRRRVHLDRGPARGVHASG